MPRIRCLYLDCVFLDDGFCGAPAIEIDPDMGCTTYTRVGDLDVDDKWGDEEELDGWEDIDSEDDDEIWLDDDKF